jgi:hypothetical protein
MGGLKKIYVTFDIDYVDYQRDEQLDELELVFPLLKAFLETNSYIKTTWFIRIDGQIEQLYGAADYIYTKHFDKIQWLQDRGHLIGWHHHSYRKSKKGDWLQNTDEDLVAIELEKFGIMARQKGMKICRMGWGFHSNKTMQIVDKLGFILDSSAIPRPNYKWESSVKDWEGTKLDWYYPSKLDYRIAGKEHYSILEIPMTTTILSTPTDTEENVVRYINPAYHQSFFRMALNNVSDLDNLITITHPYELISNDVEHSLLSFDFQVFENNIKHASNLGYTFNSLIL